MKNIINFYACVCALVFMYMIQPKCLGTCIYVCVYKCLPVALGGFSCEVLCSYIYIYIVWLLFSLSPVVQVSLFCEMRTTEGFQ